MMKLSIVVLCVVALFAVAEVNCASHHHVSGPAPAPASSADCSMVLFNMVDCLSFVTSGSDILKPDDECCSGLKTVLKTEAQCLCEVFKSSADMGIVLNVTKTLSLPSSCGVSDSSTPDCGLNGSPPGSAPAPPTPTPVTPAAAPSGGSLDVLSPAPAPAMSSAWTIPISFVAFLVSLVVASFSYF